MVFNCKLSTKLINHASTKMNSSSRKQVNYKWINFTTEARNVCLWVLMDRFNPFGNKNNYYNCWPVMIVLFNLPVSIFMHVKGVYCVIESRNSPWHDIDIYLQLLVDELNELWPTGAIKYYSYSKGRFSMKAILFCDINDFLWYGHLLGCKTTSKYGCTLWWRGRVNVAKILDGVWLHGAQKIPIKYETSLETKSQFNGIKSMISIIGVLSGFEVLSKMKTV